MKMSASVFTKSPISDEDLSALVKSIGGMDAELDKAVASLQLTGMYQRPGVLLELYAKYPSGVIALNIERK